MRFRYVPRQVVVATAMAVAASVGVVSLTEGRIQATAAQAPSLQAALAADVAQLSDKFAGLARVMEGKYDWRPGQGVRSVGEVLNLIVAENGMLNTALTATPGTPAGGRGGRPEPIASAAALQEALTTSYAALQKTIAGLSDADLNASVRMFGQETTKRGAIMMVLGDQHEHLGQSIAYARVNGVVPPWSKPAN